MALLTLLATGTVEARAAEDLNVQLFKLQQQLAQKGNHRDMYYLGEMYEHGLGTERNLTQAFYWYHKSAEQGSVLAKRKLGMRAQIEADAAREREAAERAARAELLPPPAAAPAARPPPPAPAAPTVTAEPARREAAERERRRTEVQRQLQERLKNPRGEAFE
jgi:TPR repeat protein